MASVQIPTVKFHSTITETTKRLTAAYNSLKLISDSYGIEPDAAFVFNQASYDEFVRRVCDEHFPRIYSRKGIAKTFRDALKGDFRSDTINALSASTSKRLGLLVAELHKLA